ncbi:acetoin utilization protein AcuC [Sediminivirga luteola]|jgi:acetoin utilization protein AcuC|uniref:Acetoin utilization protein AcuC n=1 Tax=Sediminivirga luteola TaxID=1774748 RepID=A0A8J2TUR7_9MICO|nr:acetoin utilization protein AcuC [Sediminivirga luteola]MCI2264740.1 acetoin utilization protein AcuC [Sediminivirga luteola]GGA02083.1 acetoin utilization protein AcuC [Sediminivirga luteola]
MSADATEVLVVWDESFSEYNFGPTHPMHPLRLDLTAKLAIDMGLFDLSRVHIAAPGVATDESLARVHAPEFVQAVRNAEVSADIAASVREEFGIGTEDVPRFDKVHEASARIYQGSVLAAEAISSGRYSRAVNFCGGMHHAMHGKASGFCVYNDLAGAITHLLDNGYERIAYIDLDAHHGDGTESIFWDDPRVLTVSLHENGRFLFPGTGYPDEIGGNDAAASAVNIALPPRTGDQDWLRAFDAVVPQVVREFRPQVIVSQHGCDGHRQDPLTHLRLSVDAMREATVRVRALAEEHTGGRWLATGGGGYELVEVVPRVWVNLVAIAAGAELAYTSETPERWREYVLELTGRDAPRHMGEAELPPVAPWTDGYDPGSELDRAVMNTRKCVFPFYGLDPYYD